MLRGARRQGIPVPRTRCTMPARRRSRSPLDPRSHTTVVGHVASAILLGGARDARRLLRAIRHAASSRRALSRDGDLIMASRCIRSIYDWNRGPAERRPRASLLDDETLRDGLQSPSVRTPDHRRRRFDILHLIDALGIDTADIGLPGAGPHVVARRRAAGARDRRRAAARSRPNCAARTVDRRHQADRRDLAARPACRSSAARSSARARSGSTPKAGRSITPAS